MRALSFWTSVIGLLCIMQVHALQGAAADTAAVGSTSSGLRGRTYNAGKDTSEEQVIPVIADSSTVMDAVRFNRASHHQQPARSGEGWKAPRFTREGETLADVQLMPTNEGDEDASAVVAFAEAEAARVESRSEKGVFEDMMVKLEDAGEEVEAREEAESKKEKESKTEDKEDNGSLLEDLLAKTLLAEKEIELPEYDGIVDGVPVLLNEVEPCDEKEEEEEEKHDSFYKPKYITEPPLTIEEIVEESKELDDDRWIVPGAVEEEHPLGISTNQEELTPNEETENGYIIPHIVQKAHPWDWDFPHRKPLASPTGMEEEEEEEEYESPTGMEYDLDPYYEEDELLEEPDIPSDVAEDPFPAEVTEDSLEEDEEEDVDPEAYAHVQDLLEAASKDALEDATASFANMTDLVQNATEELVEEVVEPAVEALVPSPVAPLPLPAEPTLPELSEDEKKVAAKQALDLRGDMLTAWASQQNSRSDRLNTWAAELAEKEAGLTAERNSILKFLGSKIQNYEDESRQLNFGDPADDDGTLTAEDVSDAAVEEAVAESTSALADGGDTADVVESVPSASMPSDLVQAEGSAVETEASPAETALESFLQTYQHVKDRVAPRVAAGVAFLEGVELKMMSDENFVKLETLAKQATIASQNATAREEKLLAEIISNTDLPLPGEEEAEIKAEREGAPQKLTPEMFFGMNMTDIEKEIQEKRNKTITAALEVYYQEEAAALKEEDLSRSMGQDIAKQAVFKDEGEAEISKREAEEAKEAADVELQLRCNASIAEADKLLAQVNETVAATILSANATVTRAIADMEALNLTMIEEISTDEFEMEQNLNATEALKNEVLSLKEAQTSQIEAKRVALQNATNAYDAKRKALVEFADSAVKLGEAVDEAEGALKEAEGEMDAVRDELSHAEVAVVVAKANLKVYKDMKDKKGVEGVGYFICSDGSKVFDSMNCNEHGDGQKQITRMTEDYKEGLKKLEAALAKAEEKQSALEKKMGAAEEKYEAAKTALATAKEKDENFEEDLAALKAEANTLMKGVYSAKGILKRVVKQADAVVERAEKTLKKASAAMRDADREAKNRKAEWNKKMIKQHAVIAEAQAMLEDAKMEGDEKLADALEQDRITREAIAADCAVEEEAIVEEEVKEEAVVEEEVEEDVEVVEGELGKATDEAVALREEKVAKALKKLQREVEFANHRYKEALHYAFSLKQEKLADELHSAFQDIVKQPEQSPEEAEIDTLRAKLASALNSTESIEDELINKMAEGVEPKAAGTQLGALANADESVIQLARDLAQLKQDNRVKLEAQHKEEIAKSIADIRDIQARSEERSLKSKIASAPADDQEQIAAVGEGAVEEAEREAEREKEEAQKEAEEAEKEGEEMMKELEEEEEEKEEAEEKKELEEEVGEEEA